MEALIGNDDDVGYMQNTCCVAFEVDCSPIVSSYFALVYLRVFGCIGFTQIKMPIRKQKSFNEHLRSFGTSSSGVLFMDCYAMGHS